MGLLQPNFSQVIAKRCTYSFSMVKAVGELWLLSSACPIFIKLLSDSSNVGALHWLMKRTLLTCILDANTWGFHFTKPKFLISALTLQIIDFISGIH